jgi:hypothetical protein
MESAKNAVKLKHGELYNIEGVTEAKGCSRINKYFLSGTEALGFYERNPLQNFGLSA